MDAFHRAIMDIEAVIDDGGSPESVKHCIGRIMEVLERAAICPRCGSSIRHDSRHLVADPISLHGTDH